MEENLKQLLLKDLCARLPYRPKVFYEYIDDLDKKTYGYGLTLNTWCIDQLEAEKAIVKPYLRPMSSMTEEERQEYGLVLCDELSIIGIDWLNAHHFDFRNLIERGLAIDCANLNVY